MDRFSTIPIRSLIFQTIFGQTAPLRRVDCLVLLWEYWWYLSERRNRMHCPVQCLSCWLEKMHCLLKVSFQLQAFAAYKFWKCNQHFLDYQVVHLLSDTMKQDLDVAEMVINIALLQVFAQVEASLTNL